MIGLETIEPFREAYIYIWKYIRTITVKIYFKNINSFTKV